MTLLQELGEFLTSPERGYGFAIHDVKDMLAEVLLLLEHELDFRREQATLLEAVKMYRASIGIRVPRLIEPLCTSDITAMSAEAGVKVTDAFPRSPIRRARIADQLIEALVAVPFFSREQDAIFHADPHAGNLLYDETNRELVVLDWALAERLSLESRRQLVLLSVMMTLRNPRWRPPGNPRSRPQRRPPESRAARSDRKLRHPLLRATAARRIPGHAGRDAAARPDRPRRRTLSAARCSCSARSS